MTDRDARRIGLLLYPHLTALDIVGPFTVLSRLPGAWETVWVAEALDPVEDDQGLKLVPDVSFTDAPPLEILVVPGGPGQITAMGNDALIGFLRDRAAAGTRLVSVCTGSLLLAQAGLLEGKRAATHWLARDALADLGAIPVPDRVVRDGDAFTAAGVSAGIDLALELVAELEGDDWARAIQLGIEYDPQPPFDAGSPEKAPGELVELLRTNARSFMS